MKFGLSGVAIAMPELERYAAGGFARDDGLPLSSFCHSREGGNPFWLTAVRLTATGDNGFPPSRE
jgi:hypothetical protein